MTTLAKCLTRRDDLLAAQVYETFGAKRMLYANFYEYLIMADLIPFFTEEDKEWILGKTALSVYSWAE